MVNACMMPPSVHLTRPCSDDAVSEQNYISI